MSGWLSKISDWQEQGSIRIFAAAETDPRLAFIAVHKLTYVAQQLRVESRAAFITNIRQFGLEAVYALDLTG